MTTIEVPSDELSELCHRALRLAINVRLSATIIVPLTADEIRARAPGVVSEPATLDYRTLAAVPGGLYDPELFGTGSDEASELPGDDETVPPTLTRFARISLAVPLLHPLFAEHLRDEIAKRIGWQPIDVTAPSSPIAVGELVAALEAAGLGVIVMRELPVLPPSLRGMRMIDGQFEVPDLADLYRRVINRNNRNRRLAELDAPDLVRANEYTMLSKAVLCLFENEEMPTELEPVLGATSGEPLRSLRSLCSPTTGQPHHGTANLWRSLTLLECHDESRGLGTDDMSIAMPFRLHAARAVMFAMGFDLRPRA